MRYETIGSGQSLVPPTVSTACRRPSPFNIRPDTPDGAANENFAIVWEPPHLGAEACTLIGYEVSYKEENARSWERVEIGMVTRYGAMVEQGLYEVRVAARYGRQDVQVDAGEVQTPTPTPVPVCAITAEFRADVVRGVSGSWERNPACVGPVRIEYKRLPRTAWEHGIVDADQSFEIDGLALIRYRFRAWTSDANGLDHWSDVTTLEVRRDPTLAIQAGRPENVRLDNGHNYRFRAWWDAPASIPEGKRLTAYYIDLLHEDGSSERIGPRPTNTTHFYTYLPDEKGKKFTVNIISELTDGNGVKTLAYSERPDPVEIWRESFRVWWIDNTPNVNLERSRIFMMVTSNRGDASATCTINGGDINCPPRTIVSLDFTLPSDASPNPTYTVSSRVAAGHRDLAGRTDHHDMFQDEYGAADYSIVVSLFRKHGVVQIGPRAPLYVWESAAHDRIWIGWVGASRGRQNGELGVLSGYALYVSRHDQVITKDYDAAGEVTSETTTYTFPQALEADPIYVEGADTTGYLVDLPVLTEETHAGGVLTRTVTRHPIGVKYIVKAVNLWDHDSDPNSDPERVYGWYQGQRSLDLPGATSAPSAPDGLTVHHPSRGVLDLSWDYPEDGGSAVSHYVVRYRRTDSGDGYTEVRLNPTYRIDNYEHIRFAHLTGLASGERYDVAVRAVNINGNGPWAEFRSESGMGIAPD